MNPKSNIQLFEGNSAQQLSNKIQQIRDKIGSIIKGYKDMLSSKYSEKLQELPNPNKEDTSNWYYNIKLTSDKREHEPMRYGITGSFSPYEKTKMINNGGEIK